MLWHACFLRILGKEDVAQYQEIADKAFESVLAVDDLPRELADCLKASMNRRGLKLGGGHPVIAQLTYTGRHRFDAAGRIIPGTEVPEGPETWVFKCRVEVDDVVRQAS